MHPSTGVDNIIHELELHDRNVVGITNPVKIIINPVSKKPLSLVCFEMENKLHAPDSDRAIQGKRRLLGKSRHPPDKEGYNNASNLKQLMESHKCATHELPWIARLHKHAPDMKRRQENQVLAERKCCNKRSVGAWAKGAEKDGSLCKAFKPVHFAF